MTLDFPLTTGGDPDTTDDRYVVVRVSNSTGQSRTMGMLFVGEQGSQDAHRVAEGWNVPGGEWQAFVVGLRSAKV